MRPTAAAMGSGAAAASASTSKPLVRKNCDHSTVTMYTMQASMASVPTASGTPATSPSVWKKAVWSRLPSSTKSIAR